VVGSMVVVFLVLNMVFVWPRFADWGKAKLHLALAQDTLRKYQLELAQTNNYQQQVRNLEDGASVATEDQAIDLLRAVQAQSASSEVNLLGNSRPTSRTNQFFVEQVQSFTVQAREEQLVDFLYNLGAGDSAVRVRDLSIQPDLPQRQQLRVTVKLVASYQKRPAARPAAAPTANAQPTKKN